MTSARIGAGVAAVLVLVPVSVGASTERALQRAGAWVVQQQSGTGAFGSPDAPADQVAEVVASLVAAGVGGEPVARALDAISRTGPARATEQPAFAGRIVLGLHAAGQDPRAFAGTDYVELILQRYDPVTGQFDRANLYANALAALGVLAAGEPVPEAAVRFLRANECAGGGFGHARGCLSGADADTTSLSLSVLAGAGFDTSEPLVARALGFLGRTQTDDAGFALEPGGITNANSTGLVLSALAALGIDPATLERDGRTPVEALVALQVRSGAFGYSADRAAEDLYATVQAIPGIAGAAYPIAPAQHVPAVPEGRSPRPTSPAAPERRAVNDADPDPVASGGRPVEVLDGTAAVPLAPAGSTGRPASRAAPIAAAAVLLALATAGRASLPRRRT